MDKDGNYGEVQHQEYDPGAAFVRMSGAQKNNATSIAAAPAKIDASKSLDLGNNLLKDISKGCSENVKELLNAPLTDKI